MTVSFKVPEGRHNNVRRSPGGTTGGSPAIHRWEQMTVSFKVPEGRHNNEVSCHIPTSATIFIVSLAQKTELI